MVARIAGSMIVCVAVLIVVSCLVSLGVLWWTGSVITSAAIGTMCGLAAAFALHTAVERAGERLSDENDRSSSSRIAHHGRPMNPQGVDPKGPQK
jgi:ABC-type nickel/cobalt efflux system permease component RcnA